jgi:hypothetical protein
VTHPALAQTDAARSRFEIAESWARVRAECRDPVPIFCYPHGGRGKFGDRERQTVANVGLLGAVTAEPGYARFPGGTRPSGQLAEVPRFAWSDHRQSLIRTVAGLEGLRARRPWART